MDEEGYSVPGPRRWRSFNSNWWGPIIFGGAGLFAIVKLLYHLATHTTFVVSGRYRLYHHVVYPGDARWWGYFWLGAVFAGIGAIMAVVICIMNRDN
jgi:hypothetical protein